MEPEDRDGESARDRAFHDPPDDEVPVGESLYDLAGEIIGVELASEGVGELFFSLIEGVHRWGREVGVVA